MLNYNEKIANKILKDNGELNRKIQEIETKNAHLNEALRSARYEISILHNEIQNKNEIYTKDINNFEEMKKDFERQIKNQDERISRLIYQLSYKNEEDNKPKEIVPIVPKEIKKTSVILNQSPVKGKNVKGKERYKIYTIHYSFY